MELTYRQNGDYLIPNLEMDEQPTELIGKYGRMRKAFLKEHCKGTYNELLLTGKLDEHLLETDRLARAQVEQIVERMAKAEGVTEELKARDQMKWVGLMNNLLHTAEEIVLQEVIYS